MFVIFFLFFLFDSCTVEKKFNNGFYTLSKIDDLYRIPLVEPYQVISTWGIGGDWFIKFPYGEVAGQEGVGVIAVTVIDSIILFQSTKTYFPKDSEMRYAWFLIDSKDKSQEIYKTEDEFLQDLARRGITKPVLYDVDSLYAQFQITQSLPYYKK